MGIKPGKRDYKSIILITGQELESLQEITYMMSECFGLDNRIANYKGKRPIGLYSWDLECLEMAVEEGIKDLEKNGKKSLHWRADVQSLRSVLVRIKDEYAAHHN